MPEQTESLASRLARRDAATLKQMNAVGTDPLLALKAAACGDIDAQRQLALVGWASAIEFDPEMGTYYMRPECEDFWGMIESALIFARMAAAHGVKSDADLLVGFLAIASVADPASEPDRMGEALGWLQREADAGCERAAELLNRYVAEASPDALAIGREYLGRLKAHMPRSEELH